MKKARSSSRRPADRRGAEEEGTPTVAPPTTEQRRPDAGADGHGAEEEGAGAVAKVSSAGRSRRAWVMEKSYGAAVEGKGIEEDKDGKDKTGLGFT